MKTKVWMLYFGPCWRLKFSKHLVCIGKLRLEIVIRQTAWEPYIKKVVND